MIDPNAGTQSPSISASTSPGQPPINTVDRTLIPPSIEIGVTQAFAQVCLNTFSSKEISVLEQIQSFLEDPKSIPPIKLVGVDTKHHFFQELIAFLQFYKCLLNGKIPVNFAKQLVESSLAKRIVEEIEFFKREFPDIFQQNPHFQEILDFFHTKLFSEYEIFYTPVIKEEVTINRPIEDFKGTRLCLGCGSESSPLPVGCNGHKKDEDYTVAFEAEYHPDLVANYYSKQLWKCFPSERFNTVFYEGFAPFPCTHSLKEISRILKVGGEVRGYPHLCFKRWGLPKNRLAKFIKECGFNRYELQQETFRTCGKDFTQTSIILIK